MNPELIKRKFWNAVRPLHSPLTKAARKRLGRNYSDHPEMELPPAYETVQLEAERRLHCYLHVSPEEIERIVIVGANNGDEIPRLRHTYPRSRFLCFEPSPEWYKRITENFRTVDYVQTRELALSDSLGTATFHELPLAGNGSILPPDLDHWARFNKIKEKEVTTFQVNVSTLDKETEALEKIDVLWIDVQGAEDRVLKGGSETLQRTASVFLEIALRDSPYHGAMLFRGIDSMLNDFGFSCVGLGTDSWNYSGNALWIRDIAQRK